MKRDSKFMVDTKVTWGSCLTCLLYMIKLAHAPTCISR